MLHPSSDSAKPVKTGICEIRGNELRLACHDEVGGEASQLILKITNEKSPGNCGARFGAAFGASCAGELTKRVFSKYARQELNL